MPVIRKLSAEIIGQIAAGEVVERPASAVKELVENSIDAGAHNVTVELREGGIKYLRVTDNGCGIPAEQVRLAFERHATSKIAAAADLYNIHTLGFRGEALASVAAVSRVTLTTRTQEAPFGTRAVVEAGEFTDIRQAASPVGTTIVVEDLFCNTPVRLKFLKKPAVEAALVADYMQRLILSRPGCGLPLRQPGQDRLPQHGRRQRGIRALQPLRARGVWQTDAQGERPHERRAALRLCGRGGPCPRQPPAAVLLCQRALLPQPAPQPRAGGRLRGTGDGGALSHVLRCFWRCPFSRWM